MKLNVTVTRVTDQPYARILDSIEVHGKDRRTHTEDTEPEVGFDADVTYVPDVWRFNPFPSEKQDFVRLTEDVQHWLFRINVERVLGYRFNAEADYRAFWKVQLGLYKKDRKNGSAYLTWWRQVLKGDRSHTNRAGTDTHRDYIAEENLDADTPKLFHIVTGRFVGKLASTETRNVGGVMCKPFECINMSGDYRQFHPDTHPHLFDQPIVTGRDLVYDKGGWTITGYWWRVFHHFNKRVVFPLSLPFSDKAWYPAHLMVTGGVPMGKLSDVGQ
jgi:hypothetical protein